ncbi:MAG: hypothetical protein KAQ87_04525 [Candidatus Pacebacteria bacterium]|nr:hypothetical protein [Candidatus Paceibacterota bacterium]
METRVRGSDRQQKYPTEVVDRRNKEDKTGEIIVIKDKLQRPKGKINGILIIVSEGKTSIEISNQKLIDPILGILERELGRFHWTKNYKMSKVSTQVGFTPLETEELKTLLEETIKL